MPPAAKKKEQENEPRRSSSDMLSIRVPEKTRALIDAARRTLDKTRTEFILEAARARAETIVLDQRMFELDEVQTVALIKLLDEPPKPVPALRKLMAGRAPWE
jgi:uncharacterized protein (DUF1778 family)